jgi:hypothetical protein
MKCRKKGKKEKSENMTKGLIPFKRISYGTKPNGDAWLATIIDNYLIPDYDLEYCNMLELELRYDWKIIAMASFIKSRVIKSGEYMLDLKAKEIVDKPGMPM